MSTCDFLVKQPLFTIFLPFYHLYNRSTVVIRAFRSFKCSWRRHAIFWKKPPLRYCFILSFSLVPLPFLRYQILCVKSISTNSKYTCISLFNTTCLKLLTNRRKRTAPNAIFAWCNWRAKQSERSLLQVLLYVLVFSQFSRWIFERPTVYKWLASCNVASVIIILR